jgi:hypothetical protein
MEGAPISITRTEIQMFTDVGPVWDRVFGTRLDYELTFSDKPLSKKVVVSKKRSLFGISDFYPRRVALHQPASCSSRLVRGRQAAAAAPLRMRA